MARSPNPRRPMLRALRRPAAALLLFALGACVPGVEPALTAPTFRLADGSRIVRLDPPGAFPEGAVVVRVALRATNPNPVGLRLASLDGALWLGGVQAADVTFVGGLELTPRGSSDLTIDVAVPLGRLDALVSVLGEAIAGRPLAYRVDGAVGIEVLGVATTFPPMTLARGEVRQADLLPGAPRVAFDPATTGVREARFDRVTIAIGLTIDNPSPVGFVVRAPDARLRLGDREVASFGVPAALVAGGASTTLVQEVVVNPVALGVALATQLQALAGGGAAALDAAILGRWELDFGVLGRWVSPSGTLVVGRVD